MSETRGDQPVIRTETLDPATLTEGLGRVYGQLLASFSAGHGVYADLLAARNSDSESPIEVVDLESAKEEFAGWLTKDVLVAVGADIKRNRTHTETDQGTEVGFDIIPRPNVALTDDDLTTMATAAQTELPRTLFGRGPAINRPLHSTAGATSNVGGLHFAVAPRHPNVHHSRIGSAGPIAVVQTRGQYLGELNRSLDRADGTPPELNFRCMDDYEAIAHILLAYRRITPETFRIMDPKTRYIACSTAVVDGNHSTISGLAIHPTVSVNAGGRITFGCVNAGTVVPTKAVLRKSR